MCPKWLEVKTRRFQGRKTFVRLIGQRHNWSYRGFPGKLAACEECLISRRADQQQQLQHPQQQTVTASTTTTNNSNNNNRYNNNSINNITTTNSDNNSNTSNSNDDNNNIKTLKNDSIFDSWAKPRLRLTSPTNGGKNIIAVWKMNEYSIAYSR